MANGSTIFALSSAPGRSAVAVIRVSGPAVTDVLARMAGGALEPRRAAMRTLHHPITGERLDQALVLLFKAPASETGEDVAELQTHGGRAVVAAVLNALGCVPGCRLAEPGEFARRAFANGKLDLAQAEGLIDLIDAETEGQRRQALTQATGALSRLYEGWRTDLVGALALVEAAIDFSDEADVSDKAVEQAEAAAGALLTALQSHLADGHRGEILRDGFRIVLAGPPNAGKSSLLNALARRDAAIVSAEAGTTRDVIEVRLDLDGLPVIVSDTAGIREATGFVEAEGIRRTLAQARAADLVIWLTDASEPRLEPPPELTSSAAPILHVLNKIDLAGTHHPPSQSATDGERDAGSEATPGPPSPPTPPRKGEESWSERALCARSDAAIPISALTGRGLPELTERLSAEARRRLGASADTPLITQARHRQQVERAATGLRAFLSRRPPDLELRAEELRGAAAALGRITGQIDPEDVLDQVFRRFCIGK